MINYRRKLTRILGLAFPELSNVVWSIHQKSSYALLLEFPAVKDLSKSHLTKVTNILSKNSQGRYSKEKAKEIKILAINSIGTCEWSIGFELQQSIRLIQYEMLALNII